MIIVRNVSKNYRDEQFEVNALTKVSLEVSRGEFLALAGSSGSGKTTLLNLLGCLDQPNSGQILIDNIDTSLLNETELSRLRAHKIGFIFQAFNLIPTLSAMENVEYPLLLMGEKNSLRKEKANTILERVGLGGMQHRKPASLSGGQRQRVAIARAMVKAPSLVLADEPTASLDHKTAEEILSLMYELNQEKGTTFIFSSHDPVILKRAQRIFWLVDGKERQETLHVA